MESLYLFSPDGNPQKRCTGPCGRTLPATTEYWHRHKEAKSGLSSRCKECVNNRSLFATSNSQGLTKCCIGPCGQEYPATTEYWHRDKQSKDGLRVKCKNCVKDYNKDYNQRPEVKEHAKEYRSIPEVQEHLKDYRKEYYNRPEVIEKNYHKEYGARPEVQAKRRERGKKRWSNPEVKEHRRSIYNSRPDLQEAAVMRSRKRRARKKAVQGTHTLTQIQDQLKRQKHKCYYCHKKFEKVNGRYVYHVEHTFPLSRVAGSDIPANSIDYIVLSCSPCNLRKGNKFPWEWPEGGRLL